MTAFVVGLTIGLVWAPCAGPALAFVFTLIREEPGLRAFFLLLAYAAGSAVPLLLIGYGGRAAVRGSARISAYSGAIERASGIILILCAVAFRYDWLTNLQLALAERLDYGRFAEKVEEKLVRGRAGEAATPDFAARLPELRPAPEFSGLGPWHNSAPLTLAGLRGKVVLVDFWTYSCINCIRTLPHLKGYWEKYKSMPFVLVGIHTPEFVFERSEDNVEGAIKKYGLQYPIAQDNNYATWDAFKNKYWPAKYLIDARGMIRYEHFGEGAYAETEQAIAVLLREIGEEAGGVVPEKAVEAVRPQTPEIYLNPRSASAFGNAPAKPSSAVAHYRAPDKVLLNRYYLTGDWQLVENERQVLRSGNGEVLLRFLGSEANLVLGLEEGAAPVEAAVSIDGGETKTFAVDRDDLYNLYRGPYGEHLVRLELRGPGVEAYAFTFGSE